jgi:hypothetical protein
VLEEEAVWNAPAAERDENSAESVTITGCPSDCVYVVPLETKVEMV